MNLYLIIGVVVAVFIVIAAVLLLKDRPKEPKYYILYISFEEGTYFDLLSDDRFSKLGDIIKSGEGFEITTRINEVQLKKEIGQLLNTDLSKIHVVAKRWWASGPFNMHE